MPFVVVEQLDDQSLWMCLDCGIGNWDSARSSVWCRAHTHNYDGWVKVQPGDVYIELKGRPTLADKCQTARDVNPDSEEELCS